MVINHGFKSLASLAAATIAACVLGSFAAGCGGGGGGGGGSTVVGANGVPAGTWGSTNAEIDTASTSSKLILNCVVDTLPPILTDSNGNYSFTAQYSSPPLVVTNAEYTGHVTSTTMTMTITDPKSSVVDGSYTMTFGQVKPPYTGVCAGQ